MRVSKLSDNRCAYVIIGSNGFLGESITVYLRNNQTSTINSVCNDVFNHDTQIQEIIPWVASKISTESEIKLIFAFGKGGFELSSTEANQLHQTFIALVNDIIKLLKHNSKVTIFYLSSLVANLSQLPSAYKNLVLSNEEYLKFCTSIKSTSIRIPSIWGFTNQGKLNLKACPMVIIANLLYLETATRPDYI